MIKNIYSFDKELALQDYADNIANYVQETYKLLYVEITRTLTLSSDEEAEIPRCVPLAIISDKTVKMRKKAPKGVGK